VETFKLQGNPVNPYGLEAIQGTTGYTLHEAMLMCGVGLFDFLADVFMSLFEVAVVNVDVLQASQLVKSSGVSGSVPAELKELRTVGIGLQVDPDAVTLTLDTSALETEISELRTDVDSNTLELSNTDFSPYQLGLTAGTGDLPFFPVLSGTTIRALKGDGDITLEASGGLLLLSADSFRQDLDEEARLREARGVRVSTAEGTLTGEAADLDGLRQDLDEEVGLRQTLGVRVTTAEGTLAGEVADLDALTSQVLVEVGQRQARGVRASTAEGTLAGEVAELDALASRVVVVENRAISSANLANFNNQTLSTFQDVFAAKQNRFLVGTPDVAHRKALQGNVVMPLVAGDNITIEQVEDSHLKINGSNGVDWASESGGYHYLDVGDNGLSIRTPTGLLTADFVANETVFHADVRVCNELLVQGIATCSTLESTLIRAQNATGLVLTISSGGIFVQTQESGDCVIPNGLRAGSVATASVVVNGTDVMTLLVERERKFTAAEPFIKTLDPSGGISPAIDSSKSMVADAFQTGKFRMRSSGPGVVESKDTTTMVSMYLTRGRRFPSFVSTRRSGAPCMSTRCEAIPKQKS